jgi:outer membrane protein assembly factor BamD (BamD/ComL family)
VKPRQGDWGGLEHIRAESAKAFKAQFWLEALEGYQVLKKKLGAADATQAQVQFQIAESYYSMGNYPDAVDAYRAVYKEGRPDETTLNQAFARVHEIALEYIHEKAYCAFAFDWIVYRGFSYGSDLLLGTDGLLTEYPYLPFADDAIMEIAKVHFDDEEYAEASMLYERVATTYRGGKWRSDAQYLSALSTYEQIRGIDYDQKVIQDADRKFRVYIQDNPRGRQADEARAKVNELAEMQGQSTLRTAKYYLRESQFPAARIYLGIVLERFTSTVAAREAREILSEIERVESRS